MQRRRFIKKTLYATAGLSLAGGAGAGFFHQHFSDRNNAKRIISFESLEDALRELDKIEKAQNLQIAGEWSLYKNLMHCSQSIEFSMLGYPENKAALFQKTIGKLVFNKFESQGFMRHNRNEPIPKAPEIMESNQIGEAIERLRYTIAQFNNFSGKLYPHFAYGELSKSQYQKAHAFHLADHFAAIDYTL